MITDRIFFRNFLEGGEMTKGGKWQRVLRKLFKRYLRKCQSWSFYLRFYISQIQVVNQNIYFKIGVNLYYLSLKIVDVINLTNEKSKKKQT